MELIKKSFTTRVKNLASKVSEDNLFLLASSISYYSALAIAPFMLILLGVASLVGVGVQGKIIEMATGFSPEVGKMIELIFANVNEGVNFGSISGIIGVIILLSTASLVFLQLRYSLDVIYGYFNPNASRGVWQIVREKLFAMFFVLMTGVFFIVSTTLPGLVSFFLGQENEKYLLYRALALALNIFIYVVMFWGIHIFTPSRRPKAMMAFKMALLSTAFFILGNILLASYLKGVASNSIYGAAGSLLVFLTWTYYTSFTLFLSVEVFLYLKKIGKIGNKRRLLG